MHTHGIDDADGQLEYIYGIFIQSVPIWYTTFQLSHSTERYCCQCSLLFSIPTPYAYRTKLQLCVCVQLGMVRAQSRQRSMKEEKNTFREIMQRKAFNEIHHN